MIVTLESVFSWMFSCLPCNIEHQKLVLPCYVRAHIYISKAVLVKPNTNESINQVLFIKIIMNQEIFYLPPL